MVTSSWRPGPLIGSLGDAQPTIHPQAWVAPGAVLVGRVTLGRGSSVWYNAVLRADDEEIVIAADCNIQDLCCLHADPGEPVLLADRVSLGHSAVVHGAQIGAGALIGIGAVVLGGARVGAGAMVAAGAVLRPGANVPEGALAAGVPAKVIRDLTEADRASFGGTADRYRQRAGRHDGAIWAEVPAVTGPGNDPDGSCGQPAAPLA